MKALPCSIPRPGRIGGEKRPKSPSELLSLCSKYSSTRNWRKLFIVSRLTQFSKDEIYMQLALRSQRQIHYRFHPYQPNLSRLNPSPNACSTTTTLSTWHHNITQKDGSRSLGCIFQINRNTALLNLWHLYGLAKCRLWQIFWTTRYWTTMRAQRGFSYAASAKLFRAWKSVKQTFKSHQQLKLLSIRKSTKLIPSARGNSHYIQSVSKNNLAFRGHHQSINLYELLS